MIVPLTVEIVIMHTTIMHKSHNAWVLAGTIFVHSKNACILHIA